MGVRWYPYFGKPLLLLHVSCYLIFGKSLDEPLNLVAKDFGATILKMNLGSSQG